MLWSESCALHMTSSLQERVATLSVVDYGSHKGRVDIQKQTLILAGLLSECLMECEDPFQELRCLRNEMFTTGATQGETQDNCYIPYISVEDADAVTELGRSLARLYLDNQEDSARALGKSVLEIIKSYRNLRLGVQCYHDIIRFFFSATHTVLSLEVVAHLFCDRVIDLKIAQDEWSISDALMAMSGLAGRYYAFASIEEEERNFALNTKKAQAEVAAEKYYDSSALARKSLSMLNLISAEAMRMGVFDGSDVLKGIAANDIEYRAYPHLVYSIEPSYAMLADRYEIEDYGLKSLSVAKATGRMIAVACAGQEAEMEHHVARPIAVASFIGNFEHFSPI